MNRLTRLLIILVCCFPLWTIIPFGANAVQKKRVILLKTMPVPAVLNHSKWFVKQLAILGFKHGETMDLIEFNANGDRQKAEAFLVTVLKQGRPDLVATSATLASQAAYKILRNTGIPIVFFTVSDPVGAGLIKEIGVSTGKNITGRVHTLNRQTRLNIVMRLLGGGKKTAPIRFGIVHSTYPSAMGDIRELKKLDKAREDIQFITNRVDYRKVPEGFSAMLSDVKKAIPDIEDSIDFWWEASGPLGETKEYRAALLSTSNKKIAMGLTMEAAKMGALIALSPNEAGSGIEAAHLAAAILKGSDAGKIPVTEPASFDLAINLKTALDLGIVVPPDIMKLAGKNIFQ